MNIFIYPDIFTSFDNGTTISEANEFEDCGLITSSFDSSVDPYDNFGLISVTSTPATEQITLDSNPPATLNYTTRNVDSSEDYGSLRYGLTDPFSIENYGLIIASVDERESYDLISTPVYSYGTTSKTIVYGLDTILYLESPESFGLITENPYIQYGLLTDSVTYTDYGSVSDALPANQYTDYGNNDLLASDEDYGLVITPYNEYTDYHFIFYSETVYPYGSFSISGSAAESISPATEIGSGSIAAGGVKGEAITDSYNINSTLIDTSIESSINYGLISASVDETEDFGLITNAATEVDSYGFLYPVITPFGLFEISGAASDIIFKQSFVGSGSVQNTGILEEKNTDRYSIDSILPGGSPENYGTINVSTDEPSESYGLITAPVDQAENYDYIFYTAGETVYPYGTIQISGNSDNRIESEFTHEGSGSISASGVKGEAITKFYGVDSTEADTSIEFSTSYGSVADVVTETEDFGLITNAVTELDAYGFLYPVITPYGLFEISGSAKESFKPVFIGSGSIEKSGILEEKNTDSYNIESILPGGSPEDYGSVGSAATFNESYGLITAPVDQAENYDYIFYTAGETVYPYGTITVSGDSFNELRIKFIHEGSGSISASGVKGEAITKFYGVDSTEVDTSIEFSTSYGLVTASVDETEDYGLVIDSITELDAYGLLYPVITPFGLFEISGSAKESFKPVFIGSGSIEKSGILEEKNTDSYNINSVLLGGSPEDYGTVNTSATSNESYGLIPDPVDQAENYDYIFYTAGETVYPFGTIQISGASFDELRIKFIQEGSGSIAANGVAGEAITDFYSIDSIAIDTSIEFSTSYGSVVDSVDESEDFGLITNAVTEVDSYGFLYPVITPYGLFEISGSAKESFKPVFIGSGSFEKSGILEEKNTDRYSIDSILPGGSPEDYGSVGSAATSNESYGLVTAPVDQVENYDYIFYPAGETVYPYGTIQISGDSFNELRIKFIHEGSGSISASGIKGEAITDSYNVDSVLVDTSIEFSTSHGSVVDSVDESEDFGLITNAVTEVDSYGFLYPVITPFGLFEISGSAFEKFNPTSFIGSGSIEKSGILEEKNTDRYSIDSILPGGSPEDYGTVNTSATSSESYGLIIDPVDQVENYDYIFYPAGETVYPYGTIQISGDSFNELRIKFIQEGSGSIAANGVVGEAITKFYSIDSIADDTSVEFSTSYGSVADVVTESEDFGLVIDSVTEVDSYGFLYPVITPFGLFEISGSAKESFKPIFIGSGSFEKSGVLEEKNTDSYNIDSILPGGSPEDYGSVGSAATSSENYESIIAPIDQAENYDYIFYTAGETILPYGTIAVSGASFDELRIKFIQEGSGSIAANGVVGEAITKFYSIDSIADDTSVEFSTSYGSIVDSVDETEDFGLITNAVTEIDSYGFLYPVITPFGLFDISGSASAIFKNGTYVGSGSINKEGVLEEKNTDSYNIESILLGGSPENYGTVDTSATETDSYGLIIDPVDQVENYDYIFYPAGETVYPYGTIQISGDAFTELRIQFVHEGSGSIAANGVVGEAITKFYSVDSIAVDTSIEFSTSYGSVVDVVTESEDFGLITEGVAAIDSYGFLYPEITPYGLFEISGAASNIIFKQSFDGSGSINKEGILEERNTDSYNIDSILPGGSPEDYGSVGSAATLNESYGLITASIDQAEDYYYIFYTAGETVYPFGTIQISGDAFTELRIQFIHEGSGSISASGVKGEAITDSYNIDSIAVDTSIEFSTSYGLITASVDESEDYGLVTDSVTEVDSYGFLYPVITPFGLFEISGSATESFKPASYIGSGSIANDGVLEEKNTDSYNIDSVLPGGSPEDYGSVGSAATSNESYELIPDPVDQAENYDYIFYTAGETVYPFGTIQISGASFDELRIKFIQEGSGSIAANGVAGEAITDFYSIDSIAIDTSIEFSTSYGLITSSVDETEDFGLITNAVTEIDSYGFLYPVITPFGLFEISGSASAIFKNGTYVGSGSITNDGVLEEKNTDSYNIDSILPGGSPEDYGTVNTSATEFDSYGLITASIDQAENYDYIFYPAGETVYPYGTIAVSGDAATELRIKFIQEGSGSIAAGGVAGEAITKFYSIDSVEVDTYIEFLTSYGSIVDSVDETEDFGLITTSVDEIDSYGFLYPVITPFGLFDISGSASAIFKNGTYVGSGSITNDGVLEEKNTDRYTIDSILPGGSPEDYGSVGSAATSNESYGLILDPVDQAENYDYIFYPAGETILPYGTIQISGDAFTELRIEFIQEGSGSIAANGVVGEAITKFYSVDSIAVDTSIEFSTSYGSVADVVTETEDFGLVIDSVTEFDAYGFLYPVITPFGLFNVSGSAIEAFKPAFAGSGTITESGVLQERNTDSYNIESILLGGSPENYGTVDTSATETDSYGLIIDPVDQVENYDYIFYPAGETVYPYGTITVSGDVGKRQRFAYEGLGTIDVIGYALVPQRYEGSGTFSAFGGSAEVNGSNPPDQTVPIVISGAATDLKNTYSNVGSGTIVISGDSANEFRGKATYEASGVIEISGTAGESFVPATAIGSGTLFAIGGGAEVSGSNPPDQTVPIVISGAATDLKNTYSNVGSGTFSAFGGTAESKGSNPPTGIDVQISGTAAESFTPQPYIGSGTFSAFGGSAEVNGSNPPDQTVPIVISGAATNLKNTYSNVGSGTGVFSGTAGEEFRGLSIYSAVGTIEISGAAAESFTPQPYTGSGSFSSFGGAAEVSGSNPPDQTVPIVISGAATNLKNTFSNVGSGTGVFSGAAINLKNTFSNVGSGTGVFSGTAREAFIPATAIGSGTFSAFGGSAEVSGSNPPDQTVPIVISGAATNLKNTYSNVGSGTFSAFGGSAEVKGSNPPDQTVPIVISGASTQKRKVSEIGSGTFSSFGGGAEVKGSNPPDQTLIITISGNAGERFTPATAIGSGSISETGAATDLKNTRSEVGIGTVAITGGITPNVQIYVPYWTGSGTLFAIGGAAEVSGSNPPDRFVLFTFSGTAAESFTPTTAIGSGTIQISGVGVGVSNPYRAPFVYVTII